MKITAFDGISQNIFGHSIGLFEGKLFVGASNDSNNQMIHLSEWFITIIFMT
jgi:hypothetical protein